MRNPYFAAMIYGPLFQLEIEACGTKNKFSVSRISNNLYEAKSESHMALLWKDGDQWRSSSNFICNEAAVLIGQEIERHF